MEISQKEKADVMAQMDKDTSLAQPDTSTVARQWWADTIGYETRAAIRRQQGAIDRKLKYQKEIAGREISRLKQQPDPEYDDLYNRLICQQLDNLESLGQRIPNDTPKLEYSRQLIDQNIISQISDDEIVNLISTRELIKQKQRLANTLQQGLSKTSNPEKALQFTGLLFEIDRLKTDDTWEQKIRLPEVVVKGLSGESVDLTTMLCTINEFDYQGGYTLNPNLDTYKSNPKVEPVPLIIDEMADKVDLFENYGINAGLQMYVADTDYTEIGANGPVTPKNLANLEQYMANLREYIKKYNGRLSVEKISNLTNNNPIYDKTVRRVMTQVSALRDTDFNRTWGNKFEEDVERRYDTFAKKKLYPVNIMRQESLKVARNIWAVNAGQGAVFSNIGENTVLLSTERRSRDQNYVVDREATVKFPPTIYVLEAAENWNRKIVNKEIFEAG
ncbi:hypothetical protein HYV64_05450 [Candidatus Shapirobacteria bacterium]|nr:hypothetical protein [Candidatus Shapirobacteria bacterium]